jgi:hypothetical protein
VCSSDLLLEYRLRFPGRTGKAYSLRFRIKPVDADGKTVVRENWWQGNFETHKAPPGSRSTVVPEVPKPADVVKPK